MGTYSGILTLYDLSTWDQNGNWNGWRTLHPPEHLKHVVDLLLPFLHGIESISKTLRDTIDWVEVVITLSRKVTRYYKLTQPLLHQMYGKRFGIQIAFPKLTILSGC